MFDRSCNPIKTGLLNGFSIFFYSAVQNSGNSSCWSQYHASDGPQCPYRYHQRDSNSSGRPLTHLRGFDTLFDERLRDVLCDFYSIIFLLLAAILFIKAYRDIPSVNGSVPGLKILLYHFILSL